MSVGLYEQGYDWTGSGNVYPGQGDSIAMVATTGSAASGIMGSLSQDGTSNPQASSGLQGNPITGGLVFIGLLLLIEWGVHHLGREEGDFSNLKASFLNVVLVSLIATAGIPLWKLGFAKLASLNLPFSKEINTYVSAA